MSTEPTPVVIRRNAIQAVEQQDQGVVEFARTLLALPGKTFGFVPGQCGRDSEFTVPQPAMVGADIARVRKVTQPGFKHLLIHCVDVGNGAPGGHGFKVGVPARELSQGHHFAHGPYRWCFFAIVVVEVTDECLMGALDLIHEFGAVFFPMSALSGKLRVEMSMGAVMVRHLVGPLAAHGYLDSLDGVEYQETQFAIKNVEIQDVGKARVWAKAMRGVIGLEGKPIGAQPIVIEVLEVEFGFGGIIDAHTAPLEQFDLLGIGGGGLLKDALHRDRHSSAVLD